MSTLLQLSPGTVFAKDFRVVRPLADGGMGSVYVVEQLSTGRERALKLMHPGLTVDPVSRKRFADEARAASRIESDHVVEVIGSGVDEDTNAPWLAMELLQGETLSDRVAKKGAVPPSEAHEILRQVCHALGAAHRAGLVHRDVKPDNIFLASTRRENASVMVKVLDFGIAKVVQDARAATATGAMGTPFWMAPEQTEARGLIGPPTDVWAVGLVAFYLLTARCFWKTAGVPGAPVPALLREMLFEKIPSASERAGELGVGECIPAGFDPWFAKAVHRELEGRFADATEAAEGLAAALAGEGTARAFEGQTLPDVARPAPRTEVMAAHSLPVVMAAQRPAPLPTVAPRSRTPWVVGAVVAIVAVGGLAAALAPSRGGGPRATAVPSRPATATAPGVVAPTPPTAEPVAVESPTTEPVAPPTSEPVAPSTVANPRRRAVPRAPTPGATVPPTQAPPATEAPPTPPAQENPMQNHPLGQVFQQGTQLGRERAAQRLEQYLQQNPNAPDREATQRRIDLLRGHPPTQ